jgi:hypothetical protein
MPTHAGALNPNSLEAAAKNPLSAGAFAGGQPGGGSGMMAGGLLVVLIEMCRQIQQAQQETNQRLAKLESQLQ